MPTGFFRANGPKGANGIDQVAAGAFIAPRGNIDGKVNSYTLLYTNFVEKTIFGLYPNPSGVFLDALNTHLNFLFLGVESSGCTQVFPYANLTSTATSSK